MRKSFLFLFLLGLCFAPACGGGSGDPGPAPEPFTHPLIVPENLFGGEPPQLAEPVTPEEFVELVESGDYTLLTASSREEDEAQAQADGDADLQTAREVYADEPELLQRLKRDIDPNDPDVRMLGDGNVMVRGVRGNPDEGTEDAWFQLDGRRWGARELVRSKDMYEKKETQVEIYERFYELLDENYRLQNKLPNPDDVRGEDFEYFHELNEIIGSDWDFFYETQVLEPRPVNYPASWRDEEGAGTPLNPARGLDRDGPDVLPTGLLTQVDFPLKWCATAVRSQGARGTCVFFSITGAMEARYAATRGRWVNLSEQFFYNQARKVWYDTNYGDGAWPMITLANMKNLGFIYPYERRWEYNKSRWRQGDDETQTYTRSCWAGPGGFPLYPGRFCSETNHQSPMICVTMPNIFGVPALDEPIVYCATRNPSEVERESGIGLRHAPVVSHFHRRVANHGLAKLFLFRKVPIVFCYDVPRRTFSPSRDGILPFDPSDDEILGAHCSVIMGYIANRDLPLGTPPGSGGGYYIIKNSWGSGWGDAGYFYASDDWVAKYLISMYAMASVSG